MKAAYTFLDHTADVLFRAQASSREELFIQCALAVEDTQVDVCKVDKKKKVVFDLVAKNLESLLFDFLGELLFYKDAKQLIFAYFKITMKEDTHGLHLHCVAWGERLNVQKHEPRVDVKAITYHLFEVKKMKGGWRAQVLLDI